MSFETRSGHLDQPEERSQQMRELIVSSFITLDGVMQAPGGPEEDPEGGFEHGGWSFGYWDEQMQERMGEWMSKPFDLVLGRKTYEIFAAYWPQHRDEPGAEPLNKATKHVASTTLTDLEWENSKLIEGEVPEGVRAEGGRRPGASGARQREPDSDAARARARRRVPPDGLPGRTRQGKATVRRRHAPGGPGRHELAGLLHRRDHGHLQDRRRDQVRVVRGLSARGSLSAAASAHPPAPERASTECGDRSPSRSPDPGGARSSSASSGPVHRRGGSARGPGRAASCGRGCSSAPRPRRAGSRGARSRPRARPHPLLAARARRAPRPRTTR